nr:hypothetical protein [Nocardia terrae]
MLCAEFLDGAGEGVHHSVAFTEQSRVVFAQCGQSVGVPVEDRGDPVESEVQFPQRQNLLQAQELRLLVEAVAVAADARRGQEADLDPLVIPAGTTPVHPAPRR